MFKIAKEKLYLVSNSFSCSFANMQVNKQHFSSHETNQHMMSLRSNNKQSSLTISLIGNGIKVVQEKDSASEMFAIKLNLFDFHWHQIAFR